MQSAQTDHALERWRDNVVAQVHSPRLPAPRLKPEPAERPRTIAEAAAELGLSKHTIRTWIASRRIAHIRLGRAIRIPAAEIKRVIDENTVPAVEGR